MTTMMLMFWYFVVFARDRSAAVTSVLVSSLACARSVIWRMRILVRERKKHNIGYDLWCGENILLGITQNQLWFRKRAPVDEICPWCSIRCSLFWRQQTAKYFLHSVLLFCLKVQKLHGTIRGRHEDMVWVCALWLFCWCFWDLNDFEFWKFYLMVVFVKLCPKILLAPQNLPTSPSNIKRVPECM